jgi:hypothetical protein
MRNSFTIVVFASFVFALAMNQSGRIEKPYYNPPKISSNDDASTNKKTQNNSSITGSMYPVPPADTVPWLTTFIDYASNGRSQRQLFITQDTIIVAATFVDSAGATDPNNSTQMRMRYNYSFNHGATWETPWPLDLTSDRKSRFPDIGMFSSGGQATAAVSGRLWNSPLSSGTRRAGIVSDAVLGAGSATTILLSGTLGTDLFSYPRVDGKFACVVQTPSSTTTATDTIFYTTWKPQTYSFTPLKTVNTIVLDNTSCAYTIAASPIDTNIVSVAYCYINEPNTPGAYPYPTIRYQSSTNAGNSWSTPLRIGPDGLIGGDSSQAYWNLDLKYKPATNTPYVVFSAQDNSSGASADISRKGYKICIWSPGLNGGIPVVIADWHNTTILSSAANFQRVRKMQVNSRVLSHPSVGFKFDGAEISVAYSAAQPDTSAAGFNFEDIYYQYSSDGGLSWSTPFNQTHTPDQVEKYPCLPGKYFHVTPDILYQWDRIPGSHSFTDGQQVNKVYWVFKAGADIRPVSGSGNELPGKFSLAQNYPNPFNPTTKIKFSIPAALSTGEGSGVRLLVYDILGREVATLVNSKLKPGTYEVDFDGSNYASGIYFYKLVFGEYNETKKMVILK